jgi:putative DNA methylase
MITRRLIEEELPLKVVNAESAREKSLRHGHISTMHLWWARRPLAMCRAVIFGTLMPDPGDSDERKKILNLIANAAPFEAASKASAIDPLRKLLADAYPDTPPKVLDCFAGGGAIPLEALRLGCDVTAIDLNPVAHLVEKCILEYPQRFGQPDEYGRNPLAEDFIKWAKWVRRRVEPKLAEVFPDHDKGRRPAVYFWARTMSCPNPGCRADLPLLSSFWLANSTRRKVWIDVKAQPGKIDLIIETGPPPTGVNLSNGTVKASSVTCPGCGMSMAARDVRHYARRTGFGRMLYAVLEISRNIRTYRAPTPEEIIGADALAGEQLCKLQETPDGTSPLPAESITKSQFRILRSLVYGMDTFYSLFSNRQLYVLGTLCEAARAAHDQMLADGMEPDRAVAVGTYLGFMVDKIADYGSSFTTWRTTVEASRSTFARQAITMAWDYIETYPFHKATEIWEAHVRWIERAIRHCSNAGLVPALVKRGDAQDLQFPDETFDAVIVDPPYYDAIQYGDLSDFFYVWLKRSAGHLHPDIFGTLLTPKQQEIIENRADKKSAEYISHEEFERRLQNALNEMARVVKRDGIVAIVFAHTDVEAWERLLRALRSANLIVTTSWPMRSERDSRSTALISAVLGSSVVLRCKPQHVAIEGFYDDVVRALEERIAERLDTFEDMELNGADYFVSAIGPAFEVFARYSRVVKWSGEEIEIPELMVLARRTVARHAMRRLLGADSLAKMDEASIFYLTWRWAYLTAEIPADEAYKLEKAFDVDLGHLSHPHGFARKSGSNFSLLGPHERKDLKLSTAPSLIDVLHMACRLWHDGRRRELEQLLGETGAGMEPSFWAMTRALAEILPGGNKERMMLLGLDSNRDTLSAAAARSAGDLTLFDMEPQ